MPAGTARGVLVPLIVCASSSPDTFKVVAGKRRHYAARAVADEGGDMNVLPCAVVAAGNDAAAPEKHLFVTGAEVRSHIGSRRGC